MTQGEPGYDPNPSSSTTSSVSEGLASGVPSAGSPGVGTTSGTAGAGGHSISDAGPVQFFNMNIPNLGFPTTAAQIPPFLVGLPHDQQVKWQSILPMLPQDTTYSTLEELQQACQNASEHQIA